MLKRSRLYYYSADTLDFRAAGWMRTKLVAAGLAIGLLLVTMTALVNVQYGDVFGIGIVTQNSLQAENRLLRAQLTDMTAKMIGLDRQLALLADRNNEVRLLVDLPKVDDDIRKVGAGGTDDRRDFGVSTDLNSLLNNIRSLSDRAAREIQLQNASYADVNEQYERNKSRFAHFPALKPMEGYYSTRGIGIRLHPVLGIYRKHEGLDIANEVGTPVYASADGVVNFTGREGGYGIAIEINHEYSYRTFYAHLSRVLVREGQQVKRGELIGRSGNTGLSSAPHLHYEVRQNGIPLNPDQYFFDDINPADYRALAKKTD